MDNFFIHMAPLPRLYPTELPVQSLGYVPHKRDHVRQVFETCNFSLILSGRGTYRYRGETFTVEGPCVITQFPHESMDYGPDPGTTWEELYIIYDGSAWPAFQMRNLAQLHKPWWPIRRDSQVQEQFGNLIHFVSNPNVDGMADLVDRTCERLLVESRLGENRPPATREEQLIRRIRQDVREKLFKTHDFDAIARRHGLSPATFRRYWNRYVHAPPARYVMLLRMREARRLLVETDLSIAEIALQTGFDDPLYFSRCFRRMTGMPPSHYRARYAR
jgi:AraC-like DNA-binding protein